MSFAWFASEVFRVISPPAHIFLCFGAFQSCVFYNMSGSYLFAFVKCGGFLFLGVLPFCFAHFVFLCDFFFAVALSVGGGRRVVFFDHFDNSRILILVLYSDSFSFCGVVVIVFVYVVWVL